MEVLTQKPRKLFLLLRDALENTGFGRISSKPLEVVGKTIAGTGTMKGTLLAENRPREVILPWRALRIAGWVMIGIGVATTILEIHSFLFAGTINYLLFLLGISLSLLGVKLVGVHRFSSSFIWIDIQGEAFPSSLQSEASEIAGTLPRASDLRIRVKGVSVLTRNSASRRELVRLSDTPELTRDFRELYDIVIDDVIPRVRIRKRVELIRTEAPPPPPPDE